MKQSNVSVYSNLVSHLEELKFIHYCTRFWSSTMATGFDFSQRVEYSDRIFNASVVQVLYCMNGLCFIMDGWWI